ncbi:hypothetical protein [Pseudomonas viridiflava]|uniref:hypothetical protein n=1 Tax=Pseudomonas viridiflava TaxID=33069 RepID=UPI000F037AA7|nr:hypothetical protein [Pseudomonas viridiflava]
MRQSAIWIYAYLEINLKQIGGNLSRALEKIIFKDLAGSSKRSYSNFLQHASEYHERLTPDQYPAFLRVYLEVGSRFKSHGWSGKKDIKDVGYYTHFSGKDYSDDLFFATVWLTNHVHLINIFIDFYTAIQEHIVEEDYSPALEKIGEFQKKHGWSFWVLEATFFLTSKVYGSEEARKLAKRIRDSTSGRIVGLAAAMFSERVDERYSVENFISKWHEIIPKHIKKSEIRSHYFFHALGFSDLNNSLGDVILQDFSSSIFDCYSTVIESIYSLIVGNPAMLTAGVSKCIEMLISAGVEDFRLHKLALLLTGEIPVYNYNAPGSPNAELAYKSLLEHPSCQEDVPSSLHAACELNEHGVKAIDALGKLEKESLGLRFIPLGDCLSGFNANMVGKVPAKSAVHPWLVLLSSTVAIEDVFVLPRDAAWKLIGNISTSAVDIHLGAQAALLLAARDSLVDKSLLEKISNNSAVWLGYGLIDQSRDAEVELIIENLAGAESFWTRQATKLKLSLLCSRHEIEAALELAYKCIEQDQIQSFEYPFKIIFDDNTWSDFKALDPMKTAIVAHFTNAVLGSKDEDIFYICKMACKRIQQTSDGKEILKGNFTKADKKLAVTLFSKVWIEDNLTFLNFKTSREVMNERLDVLRLLVQVHPEDEQEYAYEIMDITLRESQWEGLSHVDETRIFVNEVGILRWAEKELRPDYEAWKKAHSLTVTDDFAEEIFHFASSPTKERLDEIAGESMSDEHKILLTIISRLENKFLNDPLDGLHCYLSARIRHGTIKNTVLGPLDEAGFLAVSERLDDSIERYMNEFSSYQKETVVTPALLELSAGLVNLINDALANKIRIRSEKHPQGFISIGNSLTGFSKTAPLIGSMLDFNTFVSVIFDSFWKLLEPSLQSLYDYFNGDFQQQTYDLFDQAINKVQVIGERSRVLVAGLTRIKNSTCQKCVLAAGWFQPKSNPTDRIFSLDEAIGIATKVSKNIYPRFNANIEVAQDESLKVGLSAIGMTALVEALTTLLENCWKYSGMHDRDYVIEINSTIDDRNNILCISVTNPVSNNRLYELSPEVMDTIRGRFQKELIIENLATEGGTGLPKIARLSHRIDREVCPLPLDIRVEGGNFVVVAFIPLHQRDEAYDVYNY